MLKTLASLGICAITCIMCRSCSCAWLPAKIYWLLMSNLWTPNGAVQLEHKQVSAQCGLAAHAADRVLSCEGVPVSHVAACDSVSEGGATRRARTRRAAPQQLSHLLSTRLQSRYGHKAR
eukprot:5940963-Pleurochrysis_carterae.AAC.4